MALTRQPERAKGRVNGAAKPQGASGGTWVRPE